MDLLCNNVGLRRVLGDLSVMKRRYGASSAKRLQKRIMELLACETLSEMLDHHGARLHPLKGNRDGQFAVNVDGSRRLILEPSQEPVPRLPDGGVDLSQITSVILVEVADYHDG